MRSGLERVSSISEISSLSLSTSEILFKIYSLFRWRSLISATYSAWISSSSKPFIKFAITSDSFAVSLIMAIALSMSSKIFFKPNRRCNFSFFLFRSKEILRFTHSWRNAVHSSRISRIPMTLGVLPIKMLKLQPKLSCKGVSRKSFCMSFSGSVLRFTSIAKRKPLTSISSRA